MSQPSDVSRDAISPAPTSLNRASDSASTAEDPWDRKCVLSLDGGGIRGFASLCILKLLMDEIKQIELRHPAGAHQSSFLPLRDAETPSIDSLYQLKAKLQNEDQTIQAGGAHIAAQEQRHVDFLREAYKMDTGPEDTSEQDEFYGRRGANLTEDGGTANADDLTGYLPCHYFDYIGGTSTGGLNAIMLSRLRMSVEECLVNYPKLAEDVFGKKRSITTQIRKGSRTKYDSGTLEKAINDIVESRIPENGKPPRQKPYDYLDFRSPEDLCRTVVVAKKLGIHEQTTHIFRSYSHSEGDEETIKNPAPADTHKIWEVARATSAAPTFFSPITIDKVRYSDGGVGFNNPAQLMIDEVMSKSGLANSKLVDALDVLISIGTGKKPSPKEKVLEKAKNKGERGKAKMELKLPSLTHWLTKTSAYIHLHDMVDDLKMAAIDVELVHESIRKRANDGGFRGYFRWTGGKEVGCLDLDEWFTQAKGRHPATAEYIRENVHAYMTLPKQKDELTAAARKLVERRRARIVGQYRDSEGIGNYGKFGRFSHCTLLSCSWCPRRRDGSGELQGKTHFGTEDALLEHLQTTYHSQCRNWNEAERRRDVGRLSHYHPYKPGGPY